MFGVDKRPFQIAYEWRAWQNMRSLIQCCLDLLHLLIDRTHEKELDFFASLRMSGYWSMGMDPAFQVQTSTSGNQDKRALLADTLRADFSHVAGGNFFGIRQYNRFLESTMTTQVPKEEDR